MPVLWDFGATVNGYRSDMSRSFWFGKTPSADFKKVKKLVHQAYEAAVKTLVVGSAGTAPKENSSARTAQLVDQAARELITAAGFGAQFIHTTGHGVGLDIHEPPSLNWKSPAPLKPGMVVTVEPGIYLEGNLGYRHENTVIVTETGYQEITC